MTILTGIICTDGIVVAADSQLTNSHYGNVFFVDKISVVDFAADQVLIAQAGHAAITNRVVEIVRQQSVGVTIKSPLTVFQTIENSIREAKSHFDEDQKAAAEQCGGAELMLAFYADGKPVLRTVYIYGVGTANTSTGDYATAGAGEQLANYLFSEFCEPKLGAGNAIATSIYTIKKVKEFQKAWCGGDTKVKIMAPVSQSINWGNRCIGRVQEVSQDFVNLTEKELSALDETAKTERNGKILSILKTIGLRVAKNRQKQIESEATPSQQTT